MSWDLLNPNKNYSESLDWGIRTLKMGAKFKLFKDFPFEHRCASLNAKVFLGSHSCNWPLVNSISSSILLFLYFSKPNGKLLLQSWVVSKFHAIKLCLFYLFSFELVSLTFLLYSWSTYYKTRYSYRPPFLHNPATHCQENNAPSFYWSIINLNWREKASISSQLFQTQWFKIFIWRSKT